MRETPKTLRADVYRPKTPSADVYTTYGSL